MDSPAPLNFRAAQAAAAYGGRPALRAQIGQTGTNAAGTTPGNPTARTTATRSADGSIVPPLARQVEAQSMRIGRHQDALSPSLAAMVAGQVDSPVSRGEGFDSGAQPPQSPSQTQPASARAAYAMYTRAADRIEVATSVSVGRTLDARG